MEQEPVASSAADEASCDWQRGWNAATAEALPEIQELEQHLKELKHERLCRRIEVFQTIHHVCCMDLDEHLHSKQAAQLMDTVTQLENTAKMCVPHSKSKWSKWADELHKRIGERKEQLAKMTSVARRQLSAVRGLSGSAGASLRDISNASEAPPSSSQSEQEPVASSAADEGSS